MRERAHRVWRLWLAAALAAAVAGCAQVRRVGDQGRGRGDEKAGEGQPSTSAAPPRHEGEPSSSAAPPRDEGQPAEHGRPPLPATPSSLVTAGAARQLKEELRNRGYLKAQSSGPELDAATSDAVRRFQQEEGLAATGFPDRETLRRLNVDPKSAYRSAPDETQPEKRN
ncbi:MAG TPA: peptidoglycan-binding domain-containing protein [Anaeromyxobacteraceae bacterium]|nr:peptidoglycan-binding domain-containing protein [Anaeromyxobacteraceae bacterium]